MILIGVPMHFDKAYVISLEESEKRRSRFFRRAQKAHLEVEWFHGIRGDKVDTEALKREGTLAADFHPYQRGSLGTLLSHSATWDLIKESESEIGLIMEDDALISRSFLKKLAAIGWQEVPEDWDMLWLGWHKSSLVPVSKKVGKPKIVAGEKRCRNSGHYCYLIKSSSVDRIKGLLFPYNNKHAKDVILRNNFENFKAYFLKKRIARTPLIEFDSMRKLINHGV